MHVDAYISRKEYDQSNRVCLTNTCEPDYQTIAISAGAQDIEVLYDVNDHITIQNWPDLEKATLWKFWLRVHVQVTVLKPASNNLGKV